MLVLSRKKDESITIPELGIQIMVIEIRGDKVRLGINAPRSLDVHRCEILDAILKESDTAGERYKLLLDKILEVIAQFKQQEQKR